MAEQYVSTRDETDLPLEIAHLLLIDVVGYSKLLVNEQIDLLQKLNQIVRATECFRAAEAEGKLIRVPTGDGMALLFFRNPEEPVRCALEIGKALRDHPHIQRADSDARRLSWASMYRPRLRRQCHRELSHDARQNLPH